MSGIALRWQAGFEARYGCAVARASIAGRVGLQPSGREKGWLG